VKIRRQKRKSLSMKITQLGDVYVYIPNWLRPNHPEVKRFIRDGLKKLDSHIPDERPEQFHDAETVLQLVDTWSERMNLYPKRVQMRDMTRKWGSCSSKQNITFNTALYYLPYHLVEYVVVHELAHLQELNHKPPFWALVGQYLPNYAELEQELKDYRI